MGALEGTHARMWVLLMRPSLKSWLTLPRVTPFREPFLYGEKGVKFRSRSLPVIVNSIFKIFIEPFIKQCTLLNYGREKKTGIHINKSNALQVL